MKDIQAFPDEFKTGMSLRDYFAGQALIATSILSGNGFHDINGIDHLSKDSYRLADAMLEAREK